MTTRWLFYCYKLEDGSVAWHSAWTNSHAGVVESAEKLGDATAHMTDFNNWVRVALEHSTWTIGRCETIRLLEELVNRK